MALKEPNFQMWLFLAFGQLLSGPASTSLFYVRFLNLNTSWPINSNGLLLPSDLVGGFESTSTNEMSPQ